MHIDVDIDQLKRLVSFSERYREFGFTSAMILAKKITNEMGIDPIFRIKCQVKRKK